MNIIIIELNEKILQNSNNAEEVDNNITEMQPDEEESNNSTIPSTQMIYQLQADKDQLTIELNVCYITDIVFSKYIIDGNRN